MTEPLSSTAARGMMWMGSGTVATTLIRLGSLAILARLLTPDEFGKVAVALIIVGAADTLFLRGLHAAMIQVPELEARHRDTALVIALVAAVVAAGATLLIAPLADNILGIDGVEPLVAVLALVFPLRVAATVSGAQVNRDLAFDWVARVNVASIVVAHGFVAVAAGLAGWGVWALVLASLVASLVTSVGMVVRHPLRLPRDFDRGALKELTILAGGFTLGAAGFYTAQWVDDFGVGRWLGGAALGAYGNAYRLMSQPGDQLGGVLQSVLFPTMSRVQDEPDRLRAAYYNGMGVLALLILPVSVLLAILGEEVIEIMLGDQWFDAVVPFQVLALAMLFRTSFKMSESVAQATGAVYRRAWRQWVYAVLVFIGVLVGHRWGIKGVAVGSTIAMVINFFLMASLSMRIVRGKWRELARTHAGPIWTTVLVVVVAYPIGAVLRSAGAEAWLTLLASVVAGLVAAYVAVRRVPRVFAVEGLDRLLSLRGSSVPPPTDGRDWT